MLNRLRIAVDILGAEGQPEELIQGALKSVREHINCELVFLCDDQQLSSELKNEITVVRCNDCITQNDSLRRILNESQSTSISVGMQMLSSDEVNGFISVGNTGALMALGRHILHTPEGIDRPAVIKEFESPLDPFWMLDLGANIVKKSETLIQFAQLGIAYASEVGGVSNPSVALLNIGIEESKGPTLLRETASLLEQANWCNFSGFIEPNHLFDGEVDVVVTDGYAGNIALKAIEGTARFIRDEFLKEFIEKETEKQVINKKSRRRFGRLMKKLDSHRHNGASFVGLNGVVVKSHNGTTGKGMAAAVKQTLHEIEVDMPRKIEDFFTH